VPRQAGQQAARQPGVKRRRPGPGGGGAGPRSVAARTARRRRALKATLLVILLVFVALAATGCAVYASISSGLPDPDIRKARGRDQSTIIMDRDGKQIARLFAEQNRQDVPLDKMPKHLRDAVIATEDKRFYAHEGVDLMGITRALAVDIAKRDKAQGGSTITQQYVKQAFVSSDRTLKRKISEALLALKVEKRYSKDEILELYLNTIYFGHGAYGVEAASRAYFGKSVEKLSVAEAAMIAGVIKSPGRYSPYLNPENALDRRNTVLKQMRDQDFIDQATWQEARETPVEVTGLSPLANTAPYFLEWVKEGLVGEYGKDEVYRGGLLVRTTLDRSMQEAAEKAVADVLNREGDPSAALVAIQPSTGEVLAMVGGLDFKTQQFNVAVQGKRQPGSAFKPFVLATALAEGVSPEKTFPSAARSFDVNGKPWKVTGSSAGTNGMMRLRQATELSVNSVYAQLILDVGADNVVRTGEKLGLHKGITPVPAIALGGLEDGVSPLEMAQAYATLANGGVRTTPYGVSTVKLPDATVLGETKPSAEKAIDPGVAYLTTDILRGVIERGTGTSAKIGRQAAGKTGTTQQYRDAWFVGYTPDLVCAVWVGYPDSQREMKGVHGVNVSGGTLPAAIWGRFMKDALKDTPKTEFKQPKGLTHIEVCSESGLSATEFCPTRMSALVLANNLPPACEAHMESAEVTVPNLVGMAKAAAVSALEEAGLKAKTVDQAAAADAEPGTVISQDPKAGTKVEAGSTVTVTVASSAGGSAKSPTPTFYLPVKAAVGDPIKLVAGSSGGGGSAATYYWEFGDGTDATGQKVSHAWDAPGTYEVTLWVTESNGARGSLTKKIAIK